MVPGKIDIYAKAAEPYYKVRGIQNEGTIKRMMSELPFPVVYPLAELQEGAKENFVFSRPNIIGRSGALISAIAS